MKLDQFLRRSLAIPVAWLLFTGAAQAGVHALSISGNGWIAILIPIVFVVVVLLVIVGSLKAEERDARLGRKSDETKGWFGTHNDDSDDDDGHHHFHGHG